MKKKKAKSLTTENESRPNLKNLATVTGIGNGIRPRESGNGGIGAKNGAKVGGGTGAGNGIARGNALGKDPAKGVGAPRREERTRRSLLRGGGSSAK